MKSSRLCYICETPYQVFNVINLVLSSEMHNVNRTLFISESFNNSALLINKLIESNIFDEIHTYRINRTIFNNVLEFFLPRLFLDRCLTEDNICLSFNSIYMPVYLYFGLALKRLNKAATVYFYEDGFASYTEKNIDGIFSSLRKFSFFLNGLTINEIRPQIIYLNRPDCFDNKKTTYCLTRLYGDISDLNTNLLNNIFGYKPNILYDRKRIVYLSQPISDGNVAVNTAQRYQIIESLNNFHSETIVRLHPRESNYCEGLLETETYNSWELTCMNQICNTHILITSYSTAAFIPKILFDKEPYIVLLYKLFHYSSSLNNEIESTVNNLSKSYIDKSKIVIVSSIDDLNNFIESVI